MVPVAGRGRPGCRKGDNALARGGPAATSQSGVLSTPTILRLEAKQAPPHASYQAPPTDAISGALRLAFAEANF